jgi:hypothetical protein
LEEYREAFALYDKNKDGRVSAKELQEIFRYLGTIYQDHEILELIREQGGSENRSFNTLNSYYRFRFRGPEPVFKHAWKEDECRCNRYSSEKLIINHYSRST